MRRPEYAHREAAMQQQQVKIDTPGPAHGTAARYYAEIIQMLHHLPREMQFHGDIFNTSLDIRILRQIAKAMFSPAGGNISSVNDIPVYRPNTNLTKKEIYKLISDQGFKPLYFTTLTDVVIQHSEVSRQMTHPEILKTVSRALQINQMITNVMCDFDCMDENTIADVILENKSIKKLRFNPRKVDIKINVYGAVKIAKALKHNTQLEELSGKHFHFSIEDLKKGGGPISFDNHSQPSSVIIICGCMENNRVRRELTFSTIKISKEGAVAIANMLRQNNALINLALNYNIDDSGAEAIADALKHNTVLKNLNLSGNKIGDSGAKYIADALKHNEVLKTLKLGNNKIGDSGAAAIADALRYNRTLTALYLQMNEIGDSGATAIADALQANMVLKTLYLKSNKLNHHSKSRLHTEFENRWELQV